MTRKKSGLQAAFAASLFLSAAHAAPFNLAYEPATAPLSGAGLDSAWDAAPTIDRNLEQNATSRFFVNATAWARAGGVALLGWAPPPGAAVACPLRLRTSAVRLLGGWGPATPPGPPGSVAWPDVVFRDAEGALQWRLPALFERLDGLVLGARNALVVVLDNVPYALARSGGAVSRYGQVLGPANDTEYGAFVATLVTAVVARYGADEAARWQWRVGTEPNTRPGHWNDTSANYLGMYAAVARAVRAVLPAAQIGPGNFCPFAPGVGCSGTGETIVFPIIDGLVAQGSPVDFLSSSHYGSFKPAPGGGDPQAGYDPVWGARNALDLVALRQRHPAALSRVPLSFMEFGTLANGPAGGIDNEPGAFGAAWRVASTAAAGAHGVSEFFDWGASSPDFALADNAASGAPSADPDLSRLVYTSATLLRAFASTARNATGTAVLVARGAGVASCFPELEVAPGACVVPRSSAAPGAVQVAGLASVAGASAATSTLAPLAAGQLGPAAAGTVFLLATAFSVDRNSTEAAEVTLGFACPPAWGAAACAGGAPPALAVLLDASTCLFDVALAQAVHNGTVKPGNGGLPDGLTQMVTAAGLASMRDNAAWWMALQAASLRPRAAAGAGVALACADGRCAATATLAPPAVLAIWVGPQA